MRVSFRGVVIALALTSLVTGAVLLWPPPRLPEQKKVQKKVDYETKQFEEAKAGKKYQLGSVTVYVPKGVASELQESMIPPKEQPKIRLSNGEKQSVVYLENLTGDHAELIVLSWVEPRPDEAIKVRYLGEKYRIFVGPGKPVNSIVLLAGEQEFLQLPRK